MNTSPTVRLISRRSLVVDSASIEVSRRGKHAKTDRLDVEKLLVSQGIRLSVDSDFLTHLPELRLWDGAALPAGLMARLRREFPCWQFVQRPILDLEAERRSAICESQEPCMAQVR